MSSDNLLLLADFFQGFTIILTLFAYIPQWRRIWLNRSSENISIRSWVIWSFSSAMAWFYALCGYYINGVGGVLFLTSTLNLIFILATLAIVYAFRCREGFAEARVRLAVDEIHDTVVGIQQLELEVENEFEEVKEAVAACSAQA